MSCGQPLLRCALVNINLNQTVDYLCLYHEYLWFENCPCDINVYGLGSISVILMVILMAKCTSG
jgi:hypothetical protein